MEVIIVLLEKFGLKGLAVILFDYGLFAAAYAWLVLIPPTPFVLGAVLVAAGALLPRLPNSDTPHAFKVGAGKASLEVSGTVRTVLFAVGALMIAGALVAGAVKLNPACPAGETFDVNSQTCARR
jgi:hypothetical protein